MDLLQKRKMLLDAAKFGQKVIDEEQPSQWINEAKSPGKEGQYFAGQNLMHGINRNLNKAQDAQDINDLGGDSNQLHAAGEIPQGPGRMQKLKALLGIE